MSWRRKRASQRYSGIDSTSTSLFRDPQTRRHDHLPPSCIDGLSSFKYIFRPTSTTSCFLFLTRDTISFVNGLMRIGVSLLDPGLRIWGTKCLEGTLRSLRKRVGSVVRIPRDAYPHTRELSSARVGQLSQFHMIELMVKQSIGSCCIYVQNQASIEILASSFGRAKKDLDSNSICGNRS